MALTHKKALTKIVNIRLPEDIPERVLVLAKEFNLHASEVYREALLRGLDQLEAPKI